MAIRAIKPQAYRPRHRRTWAPRHDRRRLPPAATFTAIMAGMAALRRYELESLAQHAIDRMDQIDGDPDWEEDDPTGGNVCDEPHDVNEYYPAPPLYGVDQSRGALNAHLIAQRHEVLCLIADVESSPSWASTEKLRQLRMRLAMIDKQEAAIWARAWPC